MTGGRGLGPATDRLHLMRPSMVWALAVLLAAVATCAFFLRDVVDRPDHRTPD